MNETFSKREKVVVGIIATWAMICIASIGIWGITTDWRAFWSGAMIGVCIGAGMCICVELTSR